MPVNRRTECGFTLLETMIVIAIVAILASIALPSYDAYVKRSRILDAVARLADARARMEDYFFDQRSYVDDAGRCGVEVAASTTDSFTVRCEGSATAYRYTASGIAAKGMAAFAYTIDQAGFKATLSAPIGWARAADCWTIRKDGFCV
jgi:type IV pilus assembly protein PilE